MALSKRLITLTFDLGEGAYGEGGADRVELAGHRVSATIVKAGGNSMGTAQIQVFGMALAQMNKLSTLGMQITLVRKNTITLSAGDDDTGLSVVFVGQITNAWGNSQAAPQVPFHVEAHVGYFDAIKPVAPASFKGATDVATILSGLATLMGKRFVNNGVDVKLSSPYFSGSAREQALAVVNAAGIQWNGLDENILEIWPTGRARSGQAPLISPATGMIGYPAFTSQGISVRTVFNKSVGLGGQINVESSLVPARGTWNVFSLDHRLDSLVPNGDWHTNIGAVRPGIGPVVSSGSAR